jgi:hypothetical protein
LHGARSGAHDDLVLAAALAVYGATRPVPVIGRVDGLSWVR